MIRNDVNAGPRPYDTLGASDIAAICKMSKYGSPLSVYMRLTGKLPWNTGQSDATEWGHIIEGAVLQHFQRNFMPKGAAFQHREKTYFHPRIEKWRATPDATSEFPPLIVDSKTYDAENHKIQALWQIWIFNEAAKAEGRPTTSKAFFHIPHFGRAPRPTEYKWDGKMFDNILSIVVRFWENYLKGIEPDLIGHDDEKRLLAMLNPLPDDAKEEQRSIETTNEIDGKMIALKLINEQAAELKQRKQKIEGEILQFIGDNYKCEGPEGSMVWFEKNGSVSHAKLIEKIKLHYKTADKVISRILEQNPELISKKTRQAKFTAKEQ